MDKIQWFDYSIKPSWQLLISIFTLWTGLCAVAKFGI